MTKFIVPRREMAQMSWPQPLIELVAQLANFAQTQTDLQQAQADLGTAQGQITALEADVETLQDDIANAPLLVPPRLPADGDGYTDEQVRDVIGTALTAGPGITITPNDGADTITVASTISAYTDEQVRDVMGAALVAGTAITITVNDAGDTVTLSPNIGTSGEFRANTADKLLATDKVWSSAGYVALTDAATVAVDMSLGFNFSVTLGGNRTLGNPSNTKDGQTGCIAITQDGTGGRTLAFASNWKFQDGNAPALNTTAGATNLLYYHVKSSTFIVGTMMSDVR